MATHESNTSGPWLSTSVAAAYELAQALGDGDAAPVATLCNDLAAMLTGLMRRK